MESEMYKSTFSRKLYYSIPVAKNSSTRDCLIKDEVFGAFCLDTTDEDDWRTSNVASVALGGNLIILPCLGTFPP